MASRVLGGLVIAVALCFSYALSAQQADDSEQRKDWYFLQRLATDAMRIERCIIYRSVAANMKGQQYDPTSAWTRFYEQTDELGREVERYIAKYKDRRNKQETIHSFTYRTWSVAFLAGNEALKDFDTSGCAGVLPSN